MFPKSLLVLAAVAIAVNAQSPCVLDCSNVAAHSNKCGPPASNLTCTCLNTQFQSDSKACIDKFCTKAEADSLTGLQQTFCRGFTPTATALPAPNTEIWIGLSVATGSSTSAPSPTSTSTGTHLKAGVGAFFGAILAAAFAL